MRTIAFFNNKSGVGKTSLVYHLAWMFGDLGVRVIAADLDPQANLTSMFLDEDRLEKLWPDGDHPHSILGAIRPILRGVGDIGEPHVEAVADGVGLLVGDLGLSRFEDRLSSAWPECHDRSESAFRVLTAFYRLIERAVESFRADVALIDVGPNLGAINRAALIASEHVVIPLAPDLSSVQGLKNLGPTLREWRSGWKERLPKADWTDLVLPGGEMRPAGYVTLQPAMRQDRPVKAYARWMARIPAVYREFVLQESTADGPTVERDPHSLAMLNHYRSLMPMAMEARKPMFALKPSDGAIGAHAGAVADCLEDFKRLAERITERCGVAMRSGVAV